MGSYRGNAMNNIARILNEKNLKATPQRIAIYGYLLENRTHPNAETIYNALKEDYPAMSLATVYKTVATLRDEGLIQEINVGEDSFRYDAYTDDHAHVICRCCHKVFDLEQPISMEKEMKNISEKLDIDVDVCKLFFYGVCGSCAEK